MTLTNVIASTALTLGSPPQNRKCKRCRDSGCLKVRARMHTPLCTDLTRWIGTVSLLPARSCGKSLLSFLSPWLNSTSAARNFDSQTPSRSVPTLKLPLICRPTGHSSQFDLNHQDALCSGITTDPLFSYAKTPRPALVWRAQPQHLGPKTHIHESPSRCSSMAAPTAPVRAGVEGEHAHAPRRFAPPISPRGNEWEERSSQDRKMWGKTCADRQGHKPPR